MGDRVRRSGYELSLVAKCGSRQHEDLQRASVINARREAEERTFICRVKYLITWPIQDAVSRDATRAISVASIKRNKDLHAAGSRCKGEAYVFVALRMANPAECSTVHQTKFPRLFDVIRREELRTKSL